MYKIECRIPIDIDLRERPQCITNLSDAVLKANSNACVEILPHEIRFKIEVFSEADLYNIKNAIVQVNYLACAPEDTIGTVKQHGEVVFTVQPNGIYIVEKKYKVGTIACDF